MSDKVEKQETETPIEMSEKEMLDSLKVVAEDLGLTFSPNIKYATLKMKVDAAIQAELQVPNKGESTKTPEDLEAEKNHAIKLDLTKLVRCMIVSNDPAMKEWDMTPYYSFSNSIITLPKQTFPLNVEWHVPKAYFDMMSAMECRIPVKSKDEKGRSITISKMIKKYNITVLPPLTEEELEALKQAQIMRDGL